jgi:hypothetical protein
MTIEELFPSFVTELEQLLLNSAHPELSLQIRSLPVVARCLCRSKNCDHFYVEKPPATGYGTGHWILELNPKRGLIVLDLIEYRIVGIEVLDRSDVKHILDRFFPVTPLE